MRIITKTIAVLTLALGLNLVASAQTTKSIRIGYTNVDYILANLPDSKAIEAELKSFKAQLDNQLQAKSKEFQEKYDAYLKGEKMMAEPIKADKQRELQDLDARIKEFEQNAEASLQKKQQTLLQPVLKKVEDAIKKVANENGFTYVFNSDAGYGTTPVLLHAPESDNISDLVLKSLGVTPKTETPATPQAVKPATGGAK
ncbi:MAG: hypothetical protein RLZZ175_1809 [Bacteroidota bacterium]|jgi:outer membrane protein